MAIIAKDNGKVFQPCPVGLHQGVCADVQDLGDLELTFGGKTTLKHMVRLVWQVDESMDDGRPFVVSARYNLSLNEKANLRKHLESWRGKAFTADELAGFDLEKLIGVNCQVNVTHRTGSDGRVWANVDTIVPLGKGMRKMAVTPDYVRLKDREPEPPKVAEMPDDSEVFVGAEPESDLVPF